MLSLLLLLLINFILVQFHSFFFIIFLLLLLLLPFFLSSSSFPLLIQPFELNICHYTFDLTLCQVTVHRPVSRLDGDLELALYGSFLPVPSLSTDKDITEVSMSY